MGTQKQFTKVKISDFCRINCQRYIAIIIIILVHTKITSEFDLYWLKQFMELQINLASC